MQPLTQKFSELLLVGLMQRRVILSLLSQPQLASAKARLDLAGPITIFPVLKGYKKGNFCKKSVYLTSVSCVLL